MVLVEAYCLKGISEQNAKRLDKRLEKNWSSLKFRIDYKNDIKRLKMIHIYIYTYIYIQCDLKEMKKH